MSPETSRIVAQLRTLGAGVQIFGRVVYVSFPAWTCLDELLTTIAKRQGGTRSVVVSAVGKVVAVDFVEFTHDGWSFQIQGPQRTPTALDWHRHMRAAS